MTLLAAPALPLHTAGKYVAGAYIVFVVMLVVYLGIMTLRTRRTRRELSELRQAVAQRHAEAELAAPELSRPAAVDQESSPAEREPAV